MWELPLALFGLDDIVIFFILTAVAAGTAVYTVDQQRKAQHGAQDAAKKMQQRQLQRDLEAGEYFEQINKKQMEMQAQSSTIKTLSNLLAERDAKASQPKVFELPAAKEYSVVDRINSAIDDFVRG